MGKKYFLMNSESLQKGRFPDEFIEYAKEHRKMFVVVDESSKFKSNKACKEEKKSMRTQAIKLLNKLPVHRCIMTGTFTSKSPVNAFDQMEILRENYFGCNMFAFERRFCVMVRLPVGRGVTALIGEDLYKQLRKSLLRAKGSGEWGYEDARRKIASRWSLSDGDIDHILNNEEYTPFKNVEELYKIVEKDCMIVKKKDCYDLPKRVYKNVFIDMPSEMEKLYKSLLNNGFTDDIVCEDTLSMFHRFQDICNGYIPKETEEDEYGNTEVYLERQKENVKISALLDTLEDIGVPEHKVIVWCNRSMLIKDTFAAVTEAGYRACLYDGDTTSKEKSRIEDEFKKGSIDIFIGNQHSGGYGLDFLKDCTYSIFLSNDHSVEVRVQAEERPERGVFTESRTVIDIAVAGTIEEKIARSLKLGKELLSVSKSDKALFDLFDSEELPVF